jgi:hypothetical protein
VSDRIPCINPRCRRTAPVERHGEGAEIICAKCFKALPQDLRTDHRRCWREIRKWRKRATRSSNPIKAARMRDIVDRWAGRLDLNWSRIRAAVIEPEKPEGLDAFFDEIGQ